MKENKNILKNKIKYVAIGDSISEGYNEYMQFGFAGEIEKNDITGISWPSYLARMLKKIDNNILESYDNFAISGSKPEDWNYFLGINNEKYNYKNSKKNIDFITKISSSKNYPQPNRLSKMFNNFETKSEKDFQYLINKISNANLITFNIGANFLLPKVPYKKFVELHFKKEKNFNLIKQEIYKIIIQVEEDILVMINQLKKINPDAKIVCVGYILPQNPLFSTINNLFQEFKESEKEFFANYIVNQFNFVLAQISKKTNIYFVDVFNETFWLENNKILTEIFYDIHPIAKGHKKIAQDVLLKLSLSNDFWKQKENEILNKLPSFNNKYLLKDKGFFSNIFDFKDLNISDDKLIELIIGLENEIIFQEDKWEKEAIKYNKKFNFELIFQDNNNESNQELNSNIKKAFLTLFTILNQHDNKNNFDDIEKILNEKNFFNFLIKSQIISKIFWEIQQSLLTKYKKNAYNNQQDFINIVIKTVFSIDNFIHYMKFFVLLHEETKNSKMLFDLFMNFIKMLLNNSNSKRIFSNLAYFITNLCLEKLDIKIKYTKLVSFLKDVDFKKNIYNFFSNIYQFTVKHIEQIKKIQNGKELFEFYFANPHDSINIVDTFNELLLSVDGFSTNIIDILIDNLKIEDASNEDIQILNKCLNICLKILNEDNFLRNNLLQFLFKIIFNNDKNSISQKLIDFLIDLENKNIWEYFSELTLQKLNLNVEEITYLIKGINFIYEKSDVNNSFYLNLTNIKTPKSILNNRNNKTNIVKLLFIFEKLLLLITEPSQKLFDLLFKLYSETKNNNLIDKQNIYYKFIFRLLLTSLLMSKKLFQDDLNINIFWTKSNLLNMNLSIVKTIFKFTTRKNELNTDKANFYLKILGEENNINLIRNCEESTYNKEQMLWYIYSFDKEPIDKYSNKNKIDIIIESLKKGYWVLDDKDEEFSK